MKVGRESLLYPPVYVIPCFALWAKRGPKSGKLVYLLTFISQDCWEKIIPSLFSEANFQRIFIPLLSNKN